MIYGKLPNQRKLHRTRAYVGDFAIEPSRAPLIRRWIAEGLVAFLTWAKPAPVALSPDDVRRLLGEGKRCREDVARRFRRMERREG
jgi:hypothetical protein